MVNDVPSLVLASSTFSSADEYCVVPTVAVDGGQAYATAKVLVPAGIVIVKDPDWIAAAENDPVPIRVATAAGVVPVTFTVTVVGFWPVPPPPPLLPPVPDPAPQPARNPAPTANTGTRINPRI